MAHYRNNSGFRVFSNVRLFLAALWHLPKIRKDEKHRFNQMFGFIRKLRFSFVALAFAVGVGVSGFMLIEKFSLLEAYYMTIITLSTVGFGEVHQLSDTGRMFTSILIIFNLGIFTFAVTSLSSLFSGGSFQHVLLELNMIDKISKLKAHHIVCGFGRHGQQVATELRRQNMPFVIIEQNEQKLDLLREDTDYLYIEGDATDDDLLVEAGIYSANSLLTTLPDDADNLFTVLTAKQLNDKVKVISRSSSPRDEMKLKKAGADYVILPEKLGGFYMASLIKNPNLVEFFTLISHIEGGKTVFEEFACARLPKRFLGLSIKESGLFNRKVVQILAIKTKDGEYIMNPDHAQTIMQSDMFLILFGDIETLNLPKI